MAGISLHPIGVIRTPFQKAAETPIQAACGEGVVAEVEVDEAFVEALADIDGFDRLWLIYWMTPGAPFRPRVVPYLDTRERGLFATRAPTRPNPIGISAVRLLSREGRILRVADIDMLDGTRLLDIKPYVPRFDSFTARAGWFDGLDLEGRTADDRFHPAGGRGAASVEGEGLAP